MNSLFEVCMVSMANGPSLEMERHCLEDVHEVVRSLGLIFPKYSLAVGSMASLGFLGCSVRY